jgi:hypothetical protein
MAKANIIRNVFKENDSKRFKIYYNSKPTNATEMDNRICINLKSTGQIIRINETEAYDMIVELTKALKFKHQKTNRYL